MPQQEHKSPVQESTSTRPVQSVAPQARDSVRESGNDSLVELWDSSSMPDAGPAHSSNLVDLMGDGTDDVPPDAGSSRPQPLLSFDGMIDGTICSAPAAEDDPSSLVDVTGPNLMTLSYQHALQHASGERQEHERELDDVQLLMTNGETLLKEGTQVRQRSFDVAVVPSLHLPTDEFISFSLLLTGQ